MRHFFTEIYEQPCCEPDNASLLRYSNEDTYKKLLGVQQKVKSKNMYQELCDRLNNGILAPLKIPSPYLYSPHTQPNQLLRYLPLQSSSFDDRLQIQNGTYQHAKTQQKKTKSYYHTQQSLPTCGDDQSPDVSRETMLKKHSVPENLPEQIDVKPFRIQIQRNSTKNKRVLAQNMIQKQEIDYLQRVNNMQQKQINRLRSLLYEMQSGKDTPLCRQCLRKEREDSKTPVRSVKKHTEQGGNKTPRHINTRVDTSFSRYFDSKCTSPGYYRAKPKGNKLAQRYPKSKIK